MKSMPSGSNSKREQDGSESALCLSLAAGSSLSSDYDSAAVTDDARSSPLQCSMEHSLKKIEQDQAEMDGERRRGKRGMLETQTKSPQRPSTPACENRELHRAPSWIAPDRAHTSSTWPSSSLSLEDLLKDLESKLPNDEAVNQERGPDQERDRMCVCA